MTDDWVPEAVAGYKGWRYYLNTETMRGRFGVCLMSYVIVGTSFLTYKYIQWRRNKAKKE